MFKRSDEEKGKKEKGVNIYEVAGKAGKIVKKWGGHALTATVVLVVTKGPEIYKKMKK